MTFISKYWKWALAIFWIGLCFFLSWQNGTDTASTSLGLTGFIHQAFNLSAYNIDLDTFHMLVRKAAHVFIFGVGTFLVWFAAFKPGKNTYRVDQMWLIRSSILYFAICLLCEGGKVFIDGRHFEVPDLGLDLAGVLISFFLIDLFLIFSIKKRKVIRKSH